MYCEETETTVRAFICRIAVSFARFCDISRPPVIKSYTKKDSIRVPRFARMKLSSHLDCPIEVHVRTYFQRDVRETSRRRAGPDSGLDVKRDLVSKGK